MVKNQNSGYLLGIASDGEKTRAFAEMPEMSCLDLSGGYSVCVYVLI